MFGFMSYYVSSHGTINSFIHSISRKIKADKYAIICAYCGDVNENRGKPPYADCEMILQVLSVFAAR